MTPTHPPWAIRRSIGMAVIAAACADDDTAGDTEVSDTTTAAHSTSSGEPQTSDTQQPTTSSPATTSSSSAIDESGSTGSTSGQPQCEGMDTCGLPQVIHPWSLLQTEAHSGDGARELGVYLFDHVADADGSVVILIVPYAPDTRGARAAVQRIAPDGALQWEVALPPDALAVDIDAEDGSTLIGGGDLWMVRIDSGGDAGEVTPIAGWDAGFVDLSATAPIRVLGLREDAVPMLARVENDAVSATIEELADLPPQMQNMDFVTGGGVVVVAGWNEPELVLVAYDDDLTEVWRWSDFGGDFTFGPVVARSDDGWLTATASPPRVHFLSNDGETTDTIVIPEVDIGYGLVTTLTAVDPAAWATVVRNTKGVNDLPPTELHALTPSGTPCCPLQLFEMWEAHYPAAVSVSPAGGAVIVGTRCEGVTCNVARTVVSPR
jgi:hypothetical protein